MLRSLRGSFVHYQDAGMYGNLIQQNIAANPTGAASRRRQRFATLDRGESKREMRDEKNCSDGPRVEIVVQYEKIRGPVFEDCALHFGVGGVDNSGA